MSGVQKRAVAADESGMRLDRWFKTHFPGVRHGELEKYLRKGEVRVDGGRVKANRRLEEGEEIRIPPLNDDAAFKKAPRAPKAEDAQAIREMILYEDESILALNKPFGLAVQGGAKTTQHIDGMLASIETKGEKPRLVHRLDRDTGGVLILAKARIAAQRLSDAFKGHDIEKTYWALTVGSPRPREGTIDMPVAKKMVLVKDGAMEKVVPATGEGAKKAISHYQIIDDAGGRVAFLAMQPVTGRTHQLRVHAAAMECPIVGDGKYGGAKSKVQGISEKLHLFCRKMRFRHPTNNKLIEIEAPLQGHMKKSWDFFSFDLNAPSEWPEDLG